MIAPFTLQEELLRRATRVRGGGGHGAQVSLLSAKTKSTLFYFFSVFLNKKILKKQCADNTAKSAKIDV